MCGDGVYMGINVYFSLGAHVPVCLFVGYILNHYVILITNRARKTDLLYMVICNCYIAATMN